VKIINRTVSAIMLACLSSSSIAGQPEQWLAEHSYDQALRAQDFRRKYASYDLSSLFMPRKKFIGYIGSGYEKLEISFVSVARDPSQLDTYLVTGESKVGGGNNGFTGTIKIKQMREFSQMHYGVDDEYKHAGFKRQGIAIATYQFGERKDEPHSGSFSGTVFAFWLLDKDGILRYDDIEASYSDGYVNNQYIGVWRPHGLPKTKTANWGEYRVPYSGDLDVGAAEFSPNPKYFGKGWTETAP
jgi:hypothetical protein